MPWTWHAHPDVWLLLGSLGAAYVWMVRRVGPGVTPSGQRAVTPRQVTAFSGGLFALWLGADWPVHELAEGYLYSVHMVQHMLFTLLAPPLLLLGTPGWMLRHLLGSGRRFKVVRALARPIVAGLVFNGLLVVTHWPAFVEVTLQVELAHFLTHSVIFVAALLMWAPVAASLPEFRLSPPAQMFYLFLQSIVPTVPASFMVFAEGPFYRFYETVPRLWGIAALEDQRMAGLIMKLGGGILLWGIVTLIFFKWHALEESHERDVRVWKQLDRDVDEMTGSQR